MYYIVFNSALISVATGLLKLDYPRIIYLLIGAIYVIGLFSCVIAKIAIQKGHEYYRRTIIKKTLLEDQLGLTVPLSGYAERHSLSVGTTVGQGEHLRLLHDSEKWLSRKLRRNSITSLTSWLLVLLLVVNAAGAAGAIWLYLYSPVFPQPKSIRLVPISASVRPDSIQR